MRMPGGEDWEDLRHVRWINEKRLTGLIWVNIPNEIAIFHRDNDQTNHWV